MLNNLIALGLLVFGAYNLIHGQMADLDTTPLYFIKYGGASLLGLSILGYNLFPTLKGFKLPTLPKLTGEKSVPMAKDLGADISVKTEEEQDMVALYYITERFRAVKDQAVKDKGIALCKEVNGLLFDIHHPADKVG